MKSISIAVVLSATIVTAGIAQSDESVGSTSYVSAMTSLPAWPANAHVRSEDTRLVTVLRNAVARSSTFRDLVGALNRSDVIVYIETRKKRTGFSGYLAHHVVAAGSHRYLKVVVNRDLGRDWLTGAIAHELQHAREVAETAGVRSAADMRALFKRLDSGQCVLMRNCTETDAALRLHATVLEELSAAR